jgi:hypothetical protein
MQTNREIAAQGALILGLCLASANAAADGHKCACAHVRLLPGAALVSA